MLGVELKDLIVGLDEGLEIRLVIGICIFRPRDGTKKRRRSGKAIAEYGGLMLLLKLMLEIFREERYDD